MEDESRKSATEEKATEEKDGDLKQADFSSSNPVTSNSPPKKREPSEVQEIHPHDEPTPSTSGPKGTEEPGTDEGPGGTGW